MPYGVNGWVEILWDWTLEEEIQQWCSFINLNRFCFYGDEVTNRLFGLTKRPCKNPYFADRGVPKDCSKHVAEEVKSNEKFIKQYGEGNFGHTWATWSEIKPCLAELKQARFAQVDANFYAAARIMFGKNKSPSNDSSA